VTRAANARVAGFTLLLYIAAGVTAMMRASGALVNIVLSLLMCFSALVLAVAFYRITRDEDAEVAMLGLTCRVAEGVLGAMFIPMQLALRSIGSAAVNRPDAEALGAINAFLASARGWNTVLDATFFAVGSALFCWLLLRGRMIPMVLAWLGLFASVLLVVALPLQLGGVLRGPLAQFIWLPMAAFEIPVALWFITKGVAAPRRSQSA
jgi:hypothetical protein